MIFGGISNRLSNSCWRQLEAYTHAHIQVTGLSRSQLRVCCGTLPANRDHAADRPLTDLVHLSRRNAKSGKKSREAPQTRLEDGRLSCGGPSHPDRSTGDTNRCATHLIRLPFGAPVRTRNWRGARL